MREVDGKTVAVIEHGNKRRRDQEIIDEELRNAAMHRIHDRVVPEILKSFQFQALRTSQISTHAGTTTRFWGWNQRANQFKLLLGQVAGVCFTHGSIAALYYVFAAYTLRAFLLLN